MRRTILIILSTAYLLCAGLWVGGFIGIGAIMAPLAFRELGNATAGVLMGHAFRAINVFSTVLVAVMLAIGVFEMFYRRRTNEKRTLLARTVLTVAGLLTTLYLAQILMPRMELERTLNHMAAFDAMHKAYENLSYVEVFVGVALMALTATINISPRREGGHHRDV